MSAVAAEAALAPGAGSLTGPLAFLTPLVASRAGWDDPEARLARALTEDDFVLHSRRVAPLARPSIAPHLEVLLRFSDEERTLLPPGTFLSVLEANGLMARLDEWVLAKILYWRSLFAGRSAPVFLVRASRSALRRRGFAAGVEAEIARYGAPPFLFCFEVAEDEALSLEPAAREALAAVRKLGCGLAIGSFGQKPESLRLVRDLQVTVVKIDGELSRRAASDPASLAKVAAIARVAKAMGVLSIAEAVETRESRDALAGAGVDCAQGEAVRPIVEELVEIACAYGAA